jgi:hypothetical protein
MSRMSRPARRCGSSMRRTHLHPHGVHAPPGHGPRPLVLSFARFRPHGHLQALLAFGQGRYFTWLPWGCNTHVPHLFFGASIHPGTCTERVGISDVAPNTRCAAARRNSVRQRRPHPPKGRRSLSASVVGEFTTESLT